MPRAAGALTYLQMASDEIIHGQRGYVHVHKTQNGRTSKKRVNGNKALEDLSNWVAEKLWQ